MPQVKIYSEDNPNEFEELTELTAIQAALFKFNIKVEQWQTQSKLNPQAEQEEILEAYGADCRRIMQAHGFAAVDVISMHSGTQLAPDEVKKIRQKFLDEHRHADDEVRFFIDGQGLFCIHEAGKVVQILCTAGDFISVPAQTRHWFDMGEQANFKCIRFFGDEEGWVANYTGDKISDRFPKLEDADLSLRGVQSTTSQSHSELTV